MRLAKEGQTVENSRDRLKNPLVLEFLDMTEDSAYSENDLESAIIGKLQAFLLDLGKELQNNNLIYLEPFGTWNYKIRHA
jgi:predicted nuclease of restriction endonuclease-like (RecB) superfamily